MNTEDKKDPEPIPLPTMNNVQEPADRGIPTARCNRIKTVLIISIIDDLLHSALVLVRILFLESFLQCPVSITKGGWGCYCGPFSPGSSSGIQPMDAYDQACMHHDESVRLYNYYVVL